VIEEKTAARNFAKQALIFSKQKKKLVPSLLWTGNQCVVEEVDQFEVQTISVRLDNDINKSN